MRGVQTTEPESDVGIVAAMAVGWMQPKLVPLQPGLLIGDKPPEGWSHLVVKSIPRLASGEKDSLPNGSAKTAAYFRTVILANVKPVDVDEKEFELTQIGVGICVPRKGEEKDVVVAADRLEALGLASFVGQKRRCSTRLRARWRRGRSSRGRRRSRCSGRRRRWSLRETSTAKST